MKRYFICLLVLAAGMALQAQTLEKIKIDSLYYNLNIEEHTASVVNMPDSDPQYWAGRYVGDIIIPEVVRYTDVDFNVTTINEFAFGSDSLTSVVIPNSVTYLGYGSFQNCPKLAKVVIGDGVPDINRYAFANCTALADVTIGAGVTEILDHVFDNCEALTKVTLRSEALVSKDYPYTLGLVNIFGPQVTEYILDGEITQIGTYAFAQCNALTSVAMPNSVTDIRDYAFYNCGQLKNVQLSSQLTHIREAAFKTCISLKTIDIPSSVTFIGRYAFSHVDSVIVQDLGAWAQITFDNEEGNPLYHAHHLYMDTLVEEVVLPEGTTHVGAHAFAYATDITKVIIPNSATSIGDGAFRGCEKLKDVIIGDGVETIGGFAFYQCVKLQNLTIGAGVNTIDNEAFKGCNAITAVTLDANAIAAKEYTSDNNMQQLFGDKVTSYTIGDHITTIGANAFNGCTAVEDLILGNSVETIGDEAFKGLTKIKSIQLPNSLQTIGAEAFRGCSNLQWLYLGSGLRKILYSAFYGCTNLQDVYTPSLTDWCAIEFSDMTCNPLYYSEDFCVSNDCWLNDNNIVLPQGLTQLNAYIFAGWKDLHKIVIPADVTSIGYNAFRYCTGLTNVTNYATTPQDISSNNVFEDIDLSNCTLYVLAEALEAYRNAEVWKDFGHIVATTIPTYTIVFVNWDGTELQRVTVEEGEIPVYTGPTPTHEDDDEYTYTFIGWGEELHPASNDGLYKAQYESHPKPQGLDDIESNANAVKVLHNGQIYILRNGRVYTITGAEVK